MNLFISEAVFVAIGVIFGVFAQLYLLVVATASIIVLLVLAAIIDNLPQMKSDGLSFLLPGACFALCILVPMWIAYFIR